MLFNFEEAKGDENSGLLHLSQCHNGVGKLFFGYDGFVSHL